MSTDRFTPFRIKTADILAAGNPENIDTITFVSVILIFETKHDMQPASQHPLFLPHLLRSPK